MLSTSVLYISLGLLAQIILLAGDFSFVRSAPFGKLASWAAGTALWGIALIGCSLNGRNLTIPAWLIVLGWTTLVASGWILVRSLFIDLPPRNTYYHVDNQPRIVTGGLYALVRHPWVYGQALLLVSLTVISGSMLMLIATPILMASTLMSTLIQDKYCFPRIFRHYREYQHETPMLVPNRKSVNLFLLSLSRQEKA